MAEPPSSPSLDPASTAWQRHVIDPIAAQLTQGITPGKIALTLAVGSSLALFPIFGTTTLLCLLAGVLLRLNQPIIQLVNALCATIHLPLIYLLFRMGYWLYGVPYTHIGIRMMNHMLWDDPREFFEKFGIDALHAVVAWAIIAPFWTLLVYLFSLPVLKEALRRRVLPIAPAPAGPPASPPVP